MVPMKRIGRSFAKAARTVGIQVRKIPVGALGVKGMIKVYRDLWFRVWISAKGYSRAGYYRSLCGIGVSALKNAFFW